MRVERGMVRVMLSVRRNDGREWAGPSEAQERALAAIEQVDAIGMGVCAGHYLLLVFDSVAAMEAQIDAVEAEVLAALRRRELWPRSRG